MAAAERRVEGASVLVADGDTVDRALIVGLLGRIGCTTREAADGVAALALARELRPDAVILDVGLAGITGYEVCHELRSQFGDRLPVVFVSGTRVDGPDRVAGFLIGADDYIVKPFEPGELVARMRGLLRRNGAPLNGEGPSADMSALTPREREVLVLLAHGHNQEQIGKELVVTERTVATHIQRVLGKLGVHSRAEAVAFAYQHGVGNGIEHDFRAHELAGGLDANGEGRLSPPLISVGGIVGATPRVV